MNIISIENINEYGFTKRITFDFNISEKDNKPFLDVRDWAKGKLERYLLRSVGFRNLSSNVHELMEITDFIAQKYELYCTDQAAVLFELKYM